MHPLGKQWRNFMVKFVPGRQLSHSFGSQPELHRLALYTANSVAFRAGRQELGYALLSQQHRTSSVFRTLWHCDYAHCDTATYLKYINNNNNMDAYIDFDFGTLSSERETSTRGL